MKTLLIATAASLLLAIPALAGATPAVDATAATSTATTKAKTQHIFNPVWAAATPAELQNQPVFGPKQQQVGKVTKVLTGTDGKISSLVVDLNSYPNLSDKVVALSQQQVRLIPRHDGPGVTVRLRTHLKALEDMPAYSG